MAEVSASTFDNGGALFGDGYAFSAAQILDLYIFELNAEIFCDELTTGENGQYLRALLYGGHQSPGL